MQLPSNHSLSDTANLTEMSHEAMIARWREGLVTPMSATMTTFAKTDGSWWAVNELAWSRISRAEQNEQLDFHHERFGRVEQAKGPAKKNGRSPWDNLPRMGG
ncbi:hypothetical protein Rhe02_10180 [Rhizocola hellebori]|uniref:Uncharacterized protein n=2 Tax=Rhizocola hellebori TaxID=1392758 RepID=A0A8J3VE26_9ACTN|nr:hypothetical protein Rhe02_10180 [Rhizocola hellebori]